MRKKRTEKVLIECSNCKKEFFTWESKILRSKKHFCSRKCKDKFQKSFKLHCMLTNTTGIIDAGYRDEVKIKFREGDRGGGIGSTGEK